MGTNIFLTKNRVWTRIIIAIVIASTLAQALPTVTYAADPAVSPTAQPQQQPQQPPDTQSCSIVSPSTYFEYCLWRPLMSTLGQVFLSIGGFFLWLAGMLFDVLVM